MKNIINKTNIVKSPIYEHGPVLVVGRILYLIIASRDDMSSENDPSLAPSLQKRRSNR
jgi:hypothetical protein